MKYLNGQATINVTYCVSVVTHHDLLLFFATLWHTSTIPKGGQLNEQIN